MSLSVESALESFDFLEQDAADEAESTPRSTASGGSECHDTGYNSTDDYNKDFEAGYIVDFMTSNRTVDDLADTNGDDRLTKFEENAFCNEEFEVKNNQCEDAMNQDNIDVNSSNDTPSCISEIFSSSSSSKLGQRSASLDAVESKQEVNNAIPSNSSSPRKRIEAAEILSEGSPQHSSYKTRSSRATSPNLSSSYGPEATVGNKVLDKVGWITTLFPQLIT